MMGHERLRTVAGHRCPRCEIRKPLCFCSFIPTIPLQTRLVVVMHRAEETLTTNTGRLAVKALPNSEVRIRGRKGEWLSRGELEAAGRHAFLLFPSAHAAELTSDFVAGLTKPVSLIVPDGSWAQARRMVRRDAGLAGMLHVKCPAGPPSLYRLRVQPFAHSLCTLEAVARSLGVLEGHAVQEQLERLLRVMVERTLWSRGLIAANQCTAAGIPLDAFAS